MNGSARRPNIFVGYSQTDAVFAQIRDAISHLDVRTFFRGDLSAGQNWAAQLRTEIKKADLVVALITPQGLDSNRVLQELGAAWALQKPILAIECRKDRIRRLPLKLSGSVQVELTDLDNPEAIARLVQDVERTLAVSRANVDRRAS